MPTRLRGNPRACPVDPSCPRTVRAGQLMCAHHWSRVPKDLQRQVWRTWRAWSRDGTPEQWQAYSEAREAALTEAGKR